MLKTSCEPCRTKKVKCDGGYPECGTCIKSRRSIPCTYELSQREKKTLRVGEACLPCRRRKKRCDGIRPTCDACRIRNAEECIYEKSEADPNDHQRSFKHVQKITPSSSSLRPNSLVPLRPKPPGFAGDVVAVSSMNTLVPSSSRRRTPPDIDRFHINLFVSVPQGSSPAQRRLSINNFYAPLEMEDSSDPYAFALSDVSLADLNMKFRMVFLSRRLSNGAYFQTHKQQALITGDLSNAIIHPFYVHFAHLVGCHMYQEFQGHFGLLYIQAVHLKLALEALATMVEEDDPVSLSRAYHFMAMAYAYTRNVRSSKYYLRKTVDIIQRRQIRCVQISAIDITHQKTNLLENIPPFSEEVQERVSFLAQILYAGTFVYLAGQPEGFDSAFDDGFDFGLPELYSGTNVKGYPDEVSLDLEWQFRYELPEAYPILFEICPIVLRVRTIILVKDATHIITWYHKQATPSQTWFSTCRVFLFQLTSHIDSVATKIAQSSDMDDERSRLMFQFIIIISLTTVAQVYHILTNNPISTAPDLMEFQRERNDALRRVLAVVDELDPFDFKFLDPFLAICWSRAIAIFTKEQEHSIRTPTVSITSQPPSDSSSLTSIWSSLPTTTTAADNTISKRRPPPPRDEKSEFETSILRLAHLYDNFIQHRFLPGTTSLCANLAAQNDRMPASRVG